MADNRISDLPTTTLTRSDLMEVEQPAETAGSRSRKGTIAEVLAMGLDDDPTLAGDSDDFAPTQAAVKAFVESSIAALAPVPFSIGVSYLADTSSTTDADPGAGNLRWNNATQSAATVLFLDDVTTGGASLTGLWAALAAGGFTYLQHPNDADVWSINLVTAVVDASGYAKLSITRLAGDGAFADNDPMLVTIEQGSTGSGTASTTQTGECISGLIVAPADGDYRIVVKAPHGGTITEITTVSASGTCTLTGKINTTPLGGTANSVSSSEQSQAHSSANVFAAGDDIVLTVSSNSSCAKMTFTIKYTRTLA